MTLTWVREDTWIWFMNIKKHINQLYSFLKWNEYLNFIPREGKGKTGHKSNPCEYSNGHLNIWLQSSLFAFLQINKNPGLLDDLEMYSCIINVMTNVTTISSNMNFKNEYINSVFCVCESLVLRWLSKQSFISKLEQWLNLGLSLNSEINEWDLCSFPPHTLSFFICKMDGFASDALSKVSTSINVIKSHCYRKFMTSISSE